VIVSGFKTRVDEGPGTPTDEVRLKFGQIRVTHTIQNSDGTTTVTRAGWDVIANKKV
jgi:type VI protein secretion system component Hcp